MKIVMNARKPSHCAAAPHDPLKPDAGKGFQSFFDQEHLKAAPAEPEKISSRPHPKKREREESKASRDEPQPASDQLASADRTSLDQESAAQAAIQLITVRTADPGNALNLSEVIQTSDDPFLLNAEVLPFTGTAVTDSMQALETGSPWMKPEAGVPFSLAGGIADPPLDAPAETGVNPSNPMVNRPQSQTRSETRRYAASMAVLAENSNPDRGLESIQKAYDAGQYQALNRRPATASDLMRGEMSSLERLRSGADTFKEEIIPGKGRGNVEQTPDAFQMPDAQNAKPITPEPDGIDPIDPADLLEKLKQGAGNAALTGKKEFVIRLSPEGLGEITVKISENSGKLSLSMVTSKPETEKLVSRHLEALKEALRPYQTDIQSVTSSAASRDERPSYGGFDLNSRQSWNGQGNPEPHRFRNIKPGVPDPGTMDDVQAFNVGERRMIGNSLLDQYI